MKIVVAITGASGVEIGARLLQVLQSTGQNTVHSIVSPPAKDVIRYEIGREIDLPSTYDWAYNDFSAPIASSSRAPDAMVIAPCSMKSLAAIAHGYSGDLITRTADIMLRIGRPLILMPRETPLSLPAIENMRTAKIAGAILLPPMVAYYPRPASIQEMTDFFVGKVMDILGLEHSLYDAWRS